MITLIKSLSDCFDDIPLYRVLLLQRSRILNKILSAQEKSSGSQKKLVGWEIPEPWSWDPPFNPSKPGVSPKAEFGLDNLWRRANSRPQEVGDRVIRAARGSRVVVGARGDTWSRW